MFLARIRPTIRTLRSPYYFRRAFSSPRPPLTILSIESSCDESGVAVVSSDGRVLANLLSSQEAVHHATGGIVPTNAAREHEVHLPRLLSECELITGSLEDLNLDAVAVTAGPGLGPSLGVGVRAASELAIRLGKPLIPINHLEGHALIARKSASCPFPFLSLVVSGGHTQLWLARDVASYEIIAETTDDALGESLDKAARMLAVDKAPTESGGAALGRAVLRGDPDRFPFTVPLSTKPNHRASPNWSFSGLKSALRRRIALLAAANPAEAALANSGKRLSIGNNNLPINEALHLSDQTRFDLAAAFQWAAFEHIRRKTVLGVQLLRRERPELKLRQLVLCGGVASSQTLSVRLAAALRPLDIEVIVPPRDLCRDNAVMIAWAALERLQCGKATTCDPNTPLFHPRWPIDREFQDLQDLQPSRIPIV